MVTASPWWLVGGLALGGLASLVAAAIHENSPMPASVASIVRTFGLTCILSLAVVLVLMPRPCDDPGHDHLPVIWRLGILAFAGTLVGVTAWVVRQQDRDVELRWERLARESIERRVACPSDPALDPRATATHPAHLTCARCRARVAEDS